MSLKIFCQKSPRHGGYFDVDRLKTEIKTLEFEVSQSDFWQDQEHAKAVSKKLDNLKDEVFSWEKIKKEADELLSFARLAKKEKESGLKQEIREKFSKLEKKYEIMEFHLLLSGKYDKESAIMAIHAGTGGTEAQDWVEMLLRMYLRFCEQMNWQVKILDKSPGTEAGIKSVTLSVEGRWAYGYLKNEAGVHRLVRISPFDAEHMRHTSFALVEALPELPEAVKIEIDPKDLRVDTFCASGHGGQSVNKTSSAVRIVHLPTKITVSCQNERSQQQNRETALKILKTKLHQLEEQEKQKEKQELRGEYAAAEWGNQIRSYVLHPYKMVKDHRTKFETQDTEAVLDGDILPFIESNLKDKVGRRGIGAK